MKEPIEVTRVNRNHWHSTKLSNIWLDIL
uniref:Uncharacterized protein n=1 Tax=Tetranychus urticae TaxID=32264 RepID=T1K620_TETUR